MPMQKRGWKEYNERLVKRGELLISLDFLESWDDELKEMNKEKRGRPYEFPERLITFMAYVHVLFLPYRQMEGFLRKLSEYIPQLKTADFTTLHKRIQKIELSLPEVKEDKELVIALDSTGVKVTNRGEWIREKWRVRRGWIKVHIAVDVNTHELIGLVVTDERTGDSKELIPLVKEAEKKGKVKKVLGDGAYDSKDNFNYLAMNGIVSAIKTRENSSTLARGSPYRAKCVRERKELGYDAWRDKYQYGERQNAEGYISGVKRIFGEEIRATSTEGAMQEAAMKFMFYDMITRIN
jgi:hypothetical protein